MNLLQNDKRFQENNNSKSKILIKEILDKDFSASLYNKLDKYTNTNILKKNNAKGKSKDIMDKLEEGYESNDSDDSMKTTSTTLTTSTYSAYSGYSDISSLYSQDSESQTFSNNINENINININMQGDGFLKILNEINELKTIIPNKENKKESEINTNIDINPNKINEDDSNNSMNNIHNIEEKKKNNVEYYPLEFYEIFPKLKKFEVSNHSSNKDFIENPLFFIKNLILKNYHESLSFTQNRFELQKFKNSTDYNYEIMNISQPLNMPLNNESITCMINGHYQNNNTDKKNKNITSINDIILKLSQTQYIQVDFIFFGYENGLIRQYALVDIKADSFSENTLPADNFFLYREFSVTNLIVNKEIEKHVICMSLSDDEQYLLAGYASNHIIIWSTSNGKTVHCFNDIFDMPIVSCEFISISENNKDFQFLVGDLSGKVRLIKFTKNTFIDNHNIIIVSNCFYPCLIIKRLRLNKRDGFEDFNINEIINKINKKSHHICIIGNLEYIELFMIHKNSLKIKSVLLIKNPDLNLLIPMTEQIKKDRADFFSQIYLREKLSNIQFPDAAFGLGYIGDLIKNNDNKEPYILFVISWKYRIRLFYFSKDLLDIQEIGWYINNSHIIKIGFIGTSLIYFIDKNNKIKILNVKSFNKISPNRKENIDDDYDNIYCKKIKNKFLIPSSDIFTLENKIKTISSHFTDTINYYTPFIINTKYNLYLMEDIKFNDNNNIIKDNMNILKKNNNIKHIHLISFREFFNEVLKKEDWNLFFCKFIDLLKTNTNNFGYIPENKEKKEDLVIDKKAKLVKYNYLGCYLEKKFLEQEQENDEFFIKPSFDFLSIGIEFAIEIGSIDYIYNEVKKLKKNDIFKKQLVFQLEPFILNNKFQTDPKLISEELITEIINYYTTSEVGNKEFNENEIEFNIEEKDNKLLKLDLILCHLNIEKVTKIENIEDIIIKNKLYCSLIYYYSNGLHMFDKPLEILFEHFTITKSTEFPLERINNRYFKKAKDSRGYYRDNYTSLIKGLKTGIFDLENNLFISKEFIGHLLMFYIQLTLKGILFPNIGKIPLTDLDKIIPKLFLFLTKRNVAIELINFDCFSYFETLTLFFLREDEINKIINDDLSSENYIVKNDINMNDQQLCPLNINQLDNKQLRTNINDYNDKSNSKTEKGDENPKNNKDCLFELFLKMIELCENLKNNILIKFDLYIFIIKISLKLEGISNAILDKALSSIFNFHNELKNIKRTMDLNNFSNLLEKIDKFKSHYSIIRKKQSYLDELSSIIKIVIKKYYIKNEPNNDAVINNLLKISMSSHFLGVKIYLYELKKDYIRCINVFLNENRKLSRRVFTFINKTLNLLKDKKDEKTLQNFKNEIKKIISNLAGVSASETFKIIQNWFNSLDIISNLNNLPKLQFRYLDKIRTIYKRKLKNEKSIEAKNDSLKKDYSEILLNYIKLLLFFEKEQRILKLLEAEEEYINVNECLKICLNKSIDVCVYLYKQIGDEKMALKICLDKINKNFEDIKKNLSNNELCSKLFNEMKKLIDESINICENNSENSALYRERKNSSLLKDTENKNNNDKIVNDNENELWLDLFGLVYTIIKGTENKNLKIFSDIRTYLSQKIETLLITMSYYADFDYILKNVSNELEFSLLKKFLNKIFYNKSHFSNLYNSYINLLSNRINKDIKIIEINEQEGKNIRLTEKEDIENELEKQKTILDRFNKYNFNYNYSRSKEITDNSNIKKNKGNIIKIEENPKIYKKCSLCGNMLNFIDKNKLENEYNDLIIFKCDHIYHMECLVKQYNSISNKFKKGNSIKENFCPKCVNIETELFTDMDNDNKNINNNLNSINEISDSKYSYKTIDSSAMEERKKKMESKIKTKKWKTLNLFDNNYFEQINILESTLGGI